MAETNRKKNQIIALSIIGGVVVIGFIVLGTVMNSGPNTAGLPNRSSPTIDETIISDRTSSASPEMSWITTGRIEMERLKKETEELRDLVDQARRDSEKKAEAIRLEYDEQLIQQAEKIAQLEAERANVAPVAPASGAVDTLNAAAQAPSNQLPPTSPPAESGPGSDFVRRSPLSRTPPRRISAIGPRASGSPPAQCD